MWASCSQRGKAVGVVSHRRRNGYDARYVCFGADFLKYVCASCPFLQWCVHASWWLRGNIDPHRSPALYSFSCNFEWYFSRNCTIYEIFITSLGLFALNRLGARISEGSHHAFCQQDTIFQFQMIPDVLFICTIFSYTYEIEGLWSAWFLLYHLFNNRPTLDTRAATQEKLHT